MNPYNSSGGGGGGTILVKYNGLDALLSYQDNYEWVHRTQ